MAFDFISKFRVKVLGQENRGKQRLKTYKLAKIRTASSVSKSVSNIIDISESGLQFVSKQPLAKGVTVEINLLFPRGRRELQLKGKVVWSGPLPGEAKQSSVSVSFTDVSEEDKDFLHLYIEKRSLLS